MRWGFFLKNCLTPYGEIFFSIRGHDLAVRGVSKYKVDMIFIILREFNTMLIHSFIIRPKQVNK